MSSGVILRKKSMRGAQQQQVWYHRLVSCPVGPLSTLGEGGDSSIMVSWGDCVMADYFTLHNPGTVLEYTVEISPETEVAI